MKNFRLNQVMLGAALSIGMFSPWSAHAALSDSKVCPSLFQEVIPPPGVEVPEVCYSGFNCMVGMRGDWLDITHEVKFDYLRDSTNGQSASALPSISERGNRIRASSSCVPVSQKDSEGYVAVLLEEVKGTGKARVTAKRRGFLGATIDGNSVDIEVRDGTHYLHPVQRASLPARVGVDRTIDLTGRGLQDLRVKTRPLTSTAITAKPAASRIATAAANLNVRTTATPQQLLAMKTAPISAVQTPPVSIVSQSYDQIRLKVNFDKQGTLSLADYLEFTIGDPAINRDLGWPSIVVQP